MRSKELRSWICFWIVITTYIYANLQQHLWIMANLGNNNLVDICWWLFCKNIS